LRNERTFYVTALADSLYTLDTVQDGTSIYPHHFKISKWILHPKGTSML